MFAHTCANAVRCGFPQYLVDVRMNCESRWQSIATVSEEAPGQKGAYSSLWGLHTHYTLCAIWDMNIQWSLS